MKQNLKERVNGKNGITLIALVITIIVLLILAGVTIATLTGDNGILTKAQNAKEKNAQKTVEEQINLAVQASRINEGLVIDKDILEQELTNNGIEITKSENDELPWTVKKDGYVYTISENGEVKEKEGLVITAGDIEILKGATEEKKVRAQILSGETGTIKWESTGNITLSATEGNEVTVNVNSNANAGETATVTAKVEGKTYQDSINVKIVAKVTGVTAEKIEVSIGDKSKIGKITAVPENAESVEVTSYVSQDITKATVDEKTGEVTGVQEGETTVTINAKGKLSGTVVTGTCSVKVTKLNHSEVVVPTITAAGNLANNDNIKEVREGNIPIPEGYNYIKGDKIGGAVITDAASGEEKVGNEFVWVPVATIADYKRTWYTGWGPFSEYSEALPEDEKTSVERYKGFYIGRYEAGDKENTEAKTLRSSNDVTKTVTIKANQAPYNYVTRTQAVSLAEGFSTKQGYKAKTKLVSSYAWDTTIAFLQKVNSDYGSSSEEGNYRDTTFSYTDITGATKTKASDSEVLVPTGQTTPVCNIYDMGGNVDEWTTEFCSYTSDPYATRGGFYGDDFAINPAGIRLSFSDVADDWRWFQAHFIYVDLSPGCSNYNTMITRTQSNKFEKGKCSCP